MATRAFPTPTPVGVRLPGSWRNLAASRHLRGRPLSCKAAISRLESCDPGKGGRGTAGMRAGWKPSPVSSSPPSWEQPIKTPRWGWGGAPGGGRLAHSDPRRSLGAESVFRWPAAQQRREAPPCRGQLRGRLRKARVPRVLRLPGPVIQAGRPARRAHREPAVIRPSRWSEPIRGAGARQTHSRGARAPPRRRLHLVPGPGSQRLVQPQELGTQAAGRRPDSDPFPGSPGTTRLPGAPSRSPGVRLPAQEAACTLSRELAPPPQARKTGCGGDRARATCEKA